MPQHLEITGGRETRKPQDWDEAKLGPCSTLSVLYSIDERGIAQMTSAWRFTEAELQALQRNGAFFLQIQGQQHPVIATWVQDSQGEPVALDAEPKPGAAAMDSLVSDPTNSGGAPGQEADPGLCQASALFAAYRDLERQAEGALLVGDLDDAGRLFVQGTVDLNAAVEAAIEAAAPARPAGSIVQIPVMTLGSVAAEAQLRKALGHPPSDVE